MSEPESYSRPSRAGAVLRRVDAGLRAWGPLLLLVLAVVYYGQYYRSGLNLGGEGGTTAVLAMRMMEGWLPIKDTFLGYNVLWFWPVAWLFEITGPNYVALRIYFFALCWLAAVLGFLVVRRVTGLGWYALGVGVLIVLIPGMLFRNYMGLLPVLNAWALLSAFVFAPATGWRKWAWFAGAGLALGVTFLVRVELGNLLLVIYAGLIALYPLGVRGDFGRRLRNGLAGGALCLAVAVAAQLPFYADAQRRGYARDFVDQYTVFWSNLLYYARKEFAPHTLSRIAPSAGGGAYVRVRSQPLKEWRQQRAADDARRAAEMRQTRPRQGLRDVFRQDSLEDAVFIVILHLPILVAAIMVAASGVGLILALVRADAAGKETALVVLVTTGCALTLFPQYFFFRPDTPHLSEFMVPFLVAMACASFYAARFVRRTRSWVGRVAALAFLALCAGSQALYAAHSFPKESAGTIAAARKRSVEMTGSNGVRVLLKRREAERLQGLHDAIVRHSAPGEWVIALPYSPTINFMTDRPSYLHNLYVDNATATKRFSAETIRDFETRRPAVIVIDQRDINDTEFSRFRNWARPVYDYIRTRYELVGTFGENEVFVRPDKLPPVL